jgi:hypothetical protein
MVALKRLADRPQDREDPRRLEQIFGTLPDAMRDESGPKAGDEGGS